MQKTAKSLSADMYKTAKQRLKSKSNRDRGKTAQLCTEYERTGRSDKDLYLNQH